MTLLADLTWFDEAQAWGILCRLTVNSANSALVPNETDWWVTLEESYPYGKITFRPAAENGLRSTFAHQLYNGRKHDTAPWRTGDICVRAPQFMFGKHVLDPDPIGRTDRLAWYLRRAIGWLESAAIGNLLPTGDPFELPDFPGVTSPRYVVAHGETQETYRTWITSRHWYGTAEMIGVGPRHNQTFVLRRFFRGHDEEILAYQWGREVADSSHLVQPAVWLRCETLPITAPYQVIDYWENLFDFLRKEGREGHFQRVIELVRDGNSHILLLGFPIPLKVGQPVCQLHWQPILLPTVSHGTKFQRGFRPNRQGYWMRDKFEFFSPKKQPDWHKAENWSREATMGRGRIDVALSKYTTLVIGVGAVGSIVAEMLVRAGGGRTVVCDGDVVDHGNLCRHSLRLEDLGRNKAEAVSARLAGVHSHADVQPIPHSFPPTDEASLGLVEGCNLILDCTGDDATLHELARHRWESEKVFCSISLSYKAARIYVFTARGRAFPMAEFQRQFADWAKKDMSEFSGEELIQAGIGCWHPAFPRGLMKCGCWRRQPSAV